MNIDLRSCTITINTNNSITIETNIITNINVITESFQVIFDNNSAISYKVRKGQQTKTLSSGSVYNYIYNQIGNNTSASFNIQVYFSNLSSNKIIVFATIPEYTLSGSLSITDTSESVPTTNYETQTIHYVGDFTVTPTSSQTVVLLKGWSTPRLDLTFYSSTGYLYGNKITLSGDATGSVGLGTTNVQLGTDFNEGRITINATDGRKELQLLNYIGRIDWEQPTISINISRYNSVGRQIDWDINGEYSYLSRVGQLSPNNSITLTYNNVSYTLYRSDSNNNDNLFWYDGTHLYKDTTGAEIGSFDINNYYLGLYIPTAASAGRVSFSASGQFILVDENDYKYSISATAYLTDNIDYRVYANSLIPSGLPAIYVHKDSNSNNAVDIYGDTNIDGDLSVYGYLRLYNQNNGLLIGDLNSSYIHFYSNQDKPFYFNRSVEINGELKVKGANLSNTLYGFIYTDKTIPSGNYTEIDNLTQYFNTTNGKLSISNGKIKVGSGVSLIKVSFNIGLNIANQDTLYSYLTRNGSNTGLWLVKYVQGAYDSVYRQDYIEVVENDEISCSVYLGNGGEVASTGRTNFTVEIIK